MFVNRLFVPFAVELNNNMLIIPLPIGDLCCAYTLVMFTRLMALGQPFW
jgi:hypothetical protein